MDYVRPDEYYNDPIVAILKRLDRIERKIHELNANLRRIAYQTGSTHEELKENV